MAHPHGDALLEYIRGQLAEATAGDLSDRELLQRFAARHEEVAFKVLLRRHGPMVFRVCQRLLERQEDAEDVFQATFLVLAKKAGSLVWRESVGAWLYQVAHRLAREARRKQRRQAARDAQAASRTVEDPLAEISGRELVAILDEELANLPERYRAPLLLCCLEGKSGDEAARQLHCSASTLKRRLRQARELLQSQLTRRGFALSAAALSALLLHGAAAASVPAALTATTLRAALLSAAGQPLVAGLVSAQAVALAHGLTQTLLLQKLKVAFVVLLVGAGLLAGTGAIARRTLLDNGAAAADVRSVAAPPEGDQPQSQDFVVARPRPEPQSGPPVAAVVETTLPTAAAQIRQLAFDGDAVTYFASAQPAGPADHFTLVFDRPVAMQAIAVTTGRPDGTDPLDAGTLEVSTDGTTFEPVADFTDGSARGLLGGRKVQAVRVRPTADLGHALAIREFVIESGPAVARFQYPVEFVVDASEAPEMKEWAEKAARTCERAYPMIIEELRSEGYRPRSQITLTLRNSYTGAASVSGTRMTASVKYFKSNPDDVGALVHVATYVVQGYRGQDNPRWLVAGIADYVRFFKFEPGKLGPIDPNRTGYDDSYRVTAAFLAYLIEHYDREIVRKLNQVLRDGKYRDDIFEELTGKSLLALDEEWRASLRR
jgi:RNA polymerase sigma factor (sigma-70 family)